MEQGECQPSNTGCSLLEIKLRLLVKGPAALSWRMRDGQDNEFEITRGHSSFIPSTKIMVYNKFPGQITPSVKPSFDGPRRRAYGEA